MKAIVLAAGVGRRFGRRTKRLPKCLIPIGRGETLLSRYFEAFRRTGVRDVVLVVGHERGKIAAACAKWARGLHIRFVTNENYRRGSLLSLQAASRELNSDVLIMDADVYFPPEALQTLLLSPKKSAFLVDTRSRSTGEEMMVLSRNGKLERLAKKPADRRGSPSGRPDGEYDVVGEATGIVKFQKRHAAILGRILSRFVREDRFDWEYEESYAGLLAKAPDVGVVPIDDFFWTEMDFEEDLLKIRRFRLSGASRSTGKSPKPRSPRRSKKAGAAASTG